MSDPNGRFILVTGYINSFHVTLLNVYGPNFDDPAFFRKIFSSLPDLSDTHLIVGGDFNCVLDSRLDRSAQSNHSYTSSMVLNDLMSSMNLVDIWRLGHPTDRDYSFFSQMHKSFSRIDYFLIDSKLISNVIASKYHNILISDHLLHWSLILIIKNSSLPGVSTHHCFLMHHSVNIYPLRSQNS